MSRSLRICLADDDPDSRNVMRELLQLLGHEVAFTTDNGEALVQRCMELEIDLVMVDLDMPKLDGLAAAEEIWTAKHIPVILVSGHADLRHVVRDQEPIATCLTKPVYIDKLTRAIDQAMAAAQQFRAQHQASP